MSGSIDTGQRFPNYCTFKDTFDEHCRVEGVAFSKDGKTVESVNRHIKMNVCILRKTSSTQDKESYDSKKSFDFYEPMVSNEVEHRCVLIYMTPNICAFYMTS